MANIIEINGVKYSQNEPPSKKRMSSKMAGILAIGAVMSGGYGMGNEYERERPKVDIVKEYGLIQLKKSLLSKNDRDWVVWVFERNYTRIK